MKYKEENYPDIFKKFFLKLSENPFENKNQLQLLVIVACEAEINQRLQALRLLICEPADSAKKSDDETIFRSRFHEVFLQLFTLCSVDILKAIEESGYSMTINETYSNQEQE